MEAGQGLRFNAVKKFRVSRTALCELLISGVPKVPRKVIVIKAISKFFSFISLAVYFLVS